jgi:outer membrane receptor for ferrienterochelin and colicin
LTIAFSQEQNEREKLFALSLKELMSVEITTAGKKAEKISEIPASVVVITREDIKTAGYTDITEILSNIPGIFMINDYYATPTPGVRGFYPGADDRNIMILVNGVNQVYDITSTYPLCKINVPVEAIDRIEVVRGPMSVIYGSSAFYGVVNIITNEASTSEISVSAGTLKTGKIYGRTAGYQGDFHFVFNGSFLNTRGIDQPINKMMSNPSALVLHGIPANYTTGGRLENTEKYLNLSAGYKSFTFDFSYNESTPEVFYLDPSPDNGTFYKCTATNVFIDYKNTVSNSIILEGKFTYSVNRTWMEYDYYFKDFYGVQQHETDAWEGELDLFSKLSERVDLTSGLSFCSILSAYNMYDLPSFGPSLEHKYSYLLPCDDIVTRAVFTQFNYQPIENLKFVAGFRLEQMPEYTLGMLIQDSIGVHFTGREDKYKQDKVALIPRLAAIWSLNDKNVIKILYGEAINRPSVFQNTNNNLNPSLSDLQPEWIKTYELNYISTPSEKILFNTSLFYNSLENLISRTSKLENGKYFTWFANGGKMTTTGAELTVKTKLVKDLQVEMSATYQKTKDLRTGFTDIQVAYSPNVLGYGKAAYCFLPGMTFALTGYYVGEMFPYYDETKKNSDDTYGARIGQKVNGYLVLGCNLRIDDLFCQGYYMNVKCSNLLDQDIYYPTTTNNPWADKGYLGACRTFLVSMGYEF